MNFFNKLNSYFTKQPQESLLKEEEDLVKNQIEKVIISKKAVNKNTFLFEKDIEAAIEKAIEDYDCNITEIDVRYNQIEKKDNLNENITEIEKIRKIGKMPISESSEFVDKYGNIKIFNGNTLLSNDNFSSIRSKNFFFKGKWCYEVVLLSHGLFQIGWGKYNTKYTNSEGVGDDIGSYAYDGYRNTYWNGNQNYNIMSNPAWDIGDIIGVCIDLDEGFIEYFHNGSPLQINFDNITIGRNEAYFPSLSFQNKEKCIVNTGQNSFYYKYISSKNNKLYSELDLALCEYNNLYNTSKILLSIINSMDLLEIFKTSSNKSNPSSLSVISSCLRAFEFLSNITCDDIFCLRELIIPFILDSTKTDSNERRGFLHFLFSTNNSKTQFMYKFLQNVIYKLEETLSLGYKEIDKSYKFAQLVIDLFKIDDLIVIWRESEEYLLDIKSIFNYSYIKLGPDIKKYHIKANKLNEIKTEYIKMINYSQFEFDINQYSNKINKLFEEIILFIMKDTRKIESSKIQNPPTNHSLLKQMLVDCINNCYNYYAVDSMLIIFSTSQKCKLADLENLTSSFLYPCMNYVINNSISFEKFSIDPWINRLNETDWFHKEIGLGGTITHITKEYIDNIRMNVNLNIKKCDFDNELHHRIMRLSYMLLKELNNSFITSMLSLKNVTIEEMDIKSKGSEFFYNQFRPMFQCLNLNSQRLLYLYMKFIIEEIIYLINLQKEIIYFIPKFIIEIPVFCFNILVHIDSPILYYDNYDYDRNPNLNSFDNNSIIFQINQLKYTSNKTIYNMLYLFNEILSNKNINNPEIIDILIKSQSLFVKNSLTNKIYMQNKSILTGFIHSHLNHILNEPYQILVFQNIFSLIKPACFIENSKIEEKLLLKNILKDVFLNNNDFYLLFLDSYNTIVNKELTSYSISLEELGKENKKVLKNSLFNNNNLKSLFTIWDKAFKQFNEALMIYEIIINTSHDLFNIDSLTYSRFSFFISTLTSRVFYSPYYNDAIEFSKTYNSNRISYLMLNIIGIYSEINRRLNDECDGRDSIRKNFILGIVRNDIDFTVYKNELSISLINSIKEEHKDDKSINIVELIEGFNSLLNILISESSLCMSNKVEIDDDDLCHICYTNKNDSEILPCKHQICWSCITIYIRQSKNCYMCNGEIKEFKKINQ